MESITMNEIFAISNEIYSTVFSTVGDILRLSFLFSLLFLGFFVLVFIVVGLIKIIFEFVRKKISNEKGYKNTNAE